MKKIAIFCGSSKGAQLIYTEAAKKLGDFLVEQNWDLVYGGSKVGLMGIVADTVLTGHGQAFGVIPNHLKNKEIAHGNLTQLIVVDDMHARKKIMTELANGFIALPGGPGTMEEIFEVITWSQIGLHQKPYAFYNVGGYYDFIQKFLDHMLAEDFISQNNYDSILITSSLEKIKIHFLNYEAPSTKTYEVNPS